MSIPKFREGDVVRDCVTGELCSVALLYPPNEGDPYLAIKYENGYCWQLTDDNKSQFIFEYSI